MNIVDAFGVGANCESFETGAAPEEGRVNLHRPPKSCEFLRASPQGGRPGNGGVRGLCQVAGADARYTMYYRNNILS